MVLSPSLVTKSGRKKKEERFWPDEGFQRERLQKRWSSGGSEESRVKKIAGEKIFTS